MVKIKLSRIKLRPIIGVYELERQLRQEIYLDIEIQISRKVNTDEIETTLDYVPLVEEIQLLESGFSPKLIESFAEAVADICLRFDLVESVTVELSKSATLKNGTPSVVINKIKNT